MLSLWSLQNGCLQFSPHNLHYICCDNWNSGSLSVLITEGYFPGCHMEQFPSCFLIERLPTVSGVTEAGRAPQLTSEVCFLVQHPGQWTQNNPRASKKTPRQLSQRLFRKPRMSEEKSSPSIDRIGRSRKSGLCPLSHLIVWKVNKSPRNGSLHTNLSWHKCEWRGDTFLGNEERRAGKTTDAATSLLL